MPGPRNYETTHRSLFLLKLVGRLLIPWLVVQSSLGWLSNHPWAGCPIVPGLVLQPSLGWLSNYPLVGCSIMPGLTRQSCLGWLSNHPFGCPIIIPWLAVQPSFLGSLSTCPSVGCPTIPWLAVQSNHSVVLISAGVSDHRQKMNDKSSCLCRVVTNEPTVPSLFHLDRPSTTAWACYTPSPLWWSTPSPFR